ncbi:MAG: helix-turn-helix transcriptional regulator [Thermoproteota archaeon]
MIEVQLFFWKKDDKKIKELEEKMKNINEQITSIKKENEELKEKISEEAKAISILRESNIKLSEALIKLAKIVEQKRKDENINSQEQKNIKKDSEYVVLEEEIIKILREKNQPIQAREISQITGRTREHVSRTLKNMADKGIVKREKKGKIFLYSLKSDS